MRSSKQGRSKKGSVAPMSDDEGITSAGTLHHSNAYQLRQESRGVSFSTPRGKIWLILVMNLAIVTTFIFVGSSRFPPLHGESVVNDALEQDQQRPNAEQALTLAVSESTATKEPQVQDTYRPGGYTKLTGNDHPDEERDLTDVSESKTETPISAVPDVYVAETPAPLEVKSEPPLPPMTGASDVNVDTEIPAPLEETSTPPSPSMTGAYLPASVVSTAPQGEISSEPASNEPYPGQRSPTEIADIISRMKEFQTPPSETLPPSLQQSSSTSIKVPESVKVESSAVQSDAFLDNLSVWLTSDSGVEVENLAACLASSGENIAACAVNSWTNQISSSNPNAADSTAFRPASQQLRPVWIPIVPDTHKQLPTVYFSCPMVTDALRIHGWMTLLFVLSPAQIETQKFFGNSPYGQFGLHGGKPSFFANNGIVESTQKLPTGQFSLVTYRLHLGYAEIKVNGGLWGGEAPIKGDTDERRIRVTVNDVVSLGNSKGACDTNAFRGRIAEVLVYDAVLDDAKVELAEKYLHDKWRGSRAFPKTAAPVATVADSDAGTAAVPPDEAAHDSLAANSVDPATEAVSIAPNDVTEPIEPIEPIEPTQQSSSTEKPRAEDFQQPPTTEKPLTGDNGVPKESTAPEVGVEDATPAPKFDPRVNIFEWTPPSDADTAKAARWTRTVKEKVNYIRNFQLGGEVLRTLIRQHKDELLALREELFG